jgi:hypothetical protein
VPFEQSFEQHAASVVHVLPSVRQVVLSAAQVPFTQLWLQQFPFEVHAAWSEVHAGYLHTPPVQSPLQQSLPAEHPAPSPRQLPGAPPPPELPGPNTVGVNPASTTFGAASSPTAVPSSPKVASAERPPSLVPLLELLPHPAAHAKRAASAIQASTRREPIIHSSKANRSPYSARPLHRIGGSVQVQPVAPAVHGPPAAVVHGTLLQQSLSCVHAWP